MNYLNAVKDSGTDEPLKVAAKNKPTGRTDRRRRARKRAARRFCSRSGATSGLKLPALGSLRPGFGVELDRETCSAEDFKGSLRLSFFIRHTSIMRLPVFQGFVVADSGVAAR